MKILIKGGSVLTLDEQDQFHERIDILIEGEHIALIGQDIDPAGVDRIINADAKLVMPGLNIAHAHSNENLFKGAFDQYPLELWLLYAFPPMDWSIPAEVIYPRTILGAAEMLLGGATTVQDDVPIMVSPDLAQDQLDSIFQAYSDIGMRVNLMIDMLDKPFQEQFPFVEQVFPNEILQSLNAGPGWTADDFIDLCKYAIQRWHEPDGRMKFVLSPSGPQWCTDEFLIRLGELSVEQNLAIHTHVLESKLQVMTGEEFYGTSVVRHLDDLGLLSPRMTLAHCIWVSDDDVSRIGDSGVTVVHNPASNMKLGSGLMPLRQLLDSGCNLALGVDGAASNDSQNPFEMMSMTAFLHKIAHPNPRLWPKSEEILRMATRGGAQSELIHHEVGALTVGMKADIIILNTNTINFTPLNDYKKHLVYSESGSSVETSIVNGEIVMEDREILTVDLEDSKRHLRSLMPALTKEFHKASVSSNRIWPYMEKIYSRAVRTPTTLNRWIKDMHRSS